MQNFIPTAYLKTALLIVLTFFYTTTAWSSSELNWHTDMDKAQQIAAKNDKHILINFTGSDWCPWCIKLDTNVFSTSEFAEFAAAELVLVKVDFPRKEQLSQEQSAANERLAKKYRVRGFPTLI
ncbi:MAG: thioredoxin family protein, partial [Desulfuromonadaceae bacterium]